MKKALDWNEKAYLQEWELLCVDEVLNLVKLLY
jgi:hypothetical protein